MSADKAVMRLLLLTKQVEETKQCRVVISNQPACVVSHQAWLPVLGDLAIDHARVPGAGVRLIEQRDLGLDADKTGVKSRLTLERMIEGISPEALSFEIR